MPSDLVNSILILEVSALAGPRSKGSDSQRCVWLGELASQHGDVISCKFENGLVCGCVFFFADREVMGSTSPPHTSQIAVLPSA